MLSGPRLAPSVPTFPLVKQSTTDTGASTVYANRRPEGAGIVQPTGKGFPQARRFQLLQRLVDQQQAFNDDQVVIRPTIVLDFAVDASY